ncbi:MAG: hypothetical protein ACRC4G_03450 [Alphaproteobacteria bacterium]
MASKKKLALLLKLLIVASGVSVSSEGMAGFPRPGNTHGLNPNRPAARAAQSRPQGTVGGPQNFQDALLGRVAQRSDIRSRGTSGASVTSEGMARFSRSGNTHGLNPHRPGAHTLASRPQGTVGGPQNFQDALLEGVAQRLAVRGRGPSVPVDFQSMSQDALLRDSMTLVQSLMHVNQPHHHDKQIPAAVGKIATLFRILNPNAELKTFQQARTDILSYAQGVDQGVFGAVPPAIPGASNHQTYHGLVAKRVDYIEPLKPQTEKLLPMCLYFAESDEAERTLVMNFGVQEGSTDSALYNNLFIYLAKRLEEQKNGNIPGNLAYQGNAGDELEAALALSATTPQPNTHDDEDLAAAIALSLQEEEDPITQLMEALSISRNEAQDVLREDPNALETLGIK